MVERLELLFAQLFLLISSVSTEQSQICVMNTVLVKQEWGDPFLVGQSDPLFVPSVMKTHILLTDHLAQEIYCKSTNNKWKAVTTKSCVFLY